MMSIQGQTLEVRVSGCSRLKDTKWVKKQKAYVSVEYGGSKFLSSICTDGGPNLTFQEKNNIILIEGLRELTVAVWSSNTMSYDNQIGSGRVLLQKVLSEGFDDSAWTIQSRCNRYAGEVCLIMHYSNANKPMTSCASPGPQYYVVPQPQPQQIPLYSAPAPAAALPQSSMYPPQYPPQAYALQASYPPQPYSPNCCPPSPYHAYPSQN